MLKGMLKSLIVAAIAFVCLLGSVQEAKAWGYIGHRAVGEIADQKLSVQAKKAVEKILKKKTLADVASWADAVRGEGTYRPTSWYHFEKIADDSNYLETLENMPKSMKQKGGVVAAILLATEKVRDAKTPADEREDALKFLVHFVGDVHQPFHTGRPDDRGATSVRLDWHGEEVSLHHLWDTAMIRTGHAEIFEQDMSLERGTSEYATYLLKTFTPGDVASQMDVEGWLNESMALRHQAYDGYKNEAKYEKFHLPKIDRQVYAAGIRLAELLNSVFAGEALPSGQKTLTSRIEDLMGRLKDVINLRPSRTAKRDATSGYPQEWWAPVARETAPAWEILPQDAKPGEVILSKRNELGILSNFASTRFVYKGKTYASVEGFWQMMKYPEGPQDERAKVKWPHTRDEVAAMSAFEAKAAGSKANALMKELGIQWVTFEGKKIDYLEKKKGAFYRLILAAEKAKLDQNPEVHRVLEKTGDLKLMPDHLQSPDSAPAWRYHEIWMDLRSQLGDCH